MLAKRLSGAAPLNGVYDRGVHTQNVTTAQASFTFSGINIGQPDSTRYLFMYVGWDSPNTISLSTVTVNGAAATFIFTRTTVYGISAAFIKLPTAATGDIVVTFTNTAVSIALDVYAIYGRPSLSATFNSTGNTTQNVPVSITLNTTPSGIVFVNARHFLRSPSGVPSPSNIPPIVSASNSIRSSKTFALKIGIPPSGFTDIYHMYRSSIVDSAVTATPDTFTSQAPVAGTTTSHNTIAAVQLN